jgi:hypothetical protein
VLRPPFAPDVTGHERDQGGATNISTFSSLLALCGQLSNSIACSGNFSIVALKVSIPGADNEKGAGRNRRP